MLPSSEPLRPVTLRVAPGGSVLLGGLGRVDVVDSELGAFFLTFCTV